jgi:hypothetical protein
MSAAPACRLDPLLVEDDFWQRPRSAADLRERLRLALVDELGDRGERARRAVVLALGTEPTRRSPADLLALVDALVAAVRREERAR